MGHPPMNANEKFALLKKDNLMKLLIISGLSRYSHFLSSKTV